MTKKTNNFLLMDLLMVLKFLTRGKGNLDSVKISNQQGNI
jgi:hypothetical protein